MSSANPWDKFFWNDWETDPALKLCSLAAQGLWMRVLCICAKADPKGYLVVAGRPLSPSDLSSLVGKPEPEVETLLRELRSYGVFSVDRNERIYSRRMVRDLKKARTAAENGKKGGNPTLSKQTQIPASDNLPDKPPDKPHKPEAISQNNPSSLRSDGPPDGANLLGEPAQAKPPKGRKAPRSPLPAVCPDDRGKLWALEYWRGKARRDLCDRIDDEIDQFRDHYAKTGELMADWDATWRTWVRNAVKFNQGQKNGTAAPYRGSGQQPRRRLADQLAEPDDNGIDGRVVDRTVTANSGPANDGDRPLLVAGPSGTGRGFNAG